LVAIYLKLANPTKALMTLNGKMLLPSRRKKTMKFSSLKPRKAKLASKRKRRKSLSLKSN